MNDYGRRENGRPAITTVPVDILKQQRTRISRTIDQHNETIKEAADQIGQSYLVNVEMREQMKVLDDAIAKLEAPEKDETSEQQA